MTDSFLLFGKVFIGASDFAKDTREAAQGLIDEQPTAYDMAAWSPTRWLPDWASSSAEAPCQP